MTDDMSRQPATSEDIGAYTLTIEEAASRYDAAGHNRTRRSIQRYCVLGHLDAKRIETPWGEKLLITPESVARHIGYIVELEAATTSRDLSRPVATAKPIDPTLSASAEPTATSVDTPRPVATSPDVSPAGATRQTVTTSLSEQRRDAPTGRDLSRPVAADSRIVELLEKQNEFLHDQIKVKDSQIASLQERAHETNALINGLQRLLSPLLGPRRDSDQSFS